MSLYYEAASILSDATGGGSLKSRIYNDASKLKSRPAQLYALITETAKYDTFLKEVIENAGILQLEPKLTPLLSLFLVHDHLFSDKHIAASKDHPLKLAILRHKARISSEFTKARLRRKCATVPQLKLLLAGDQTTTTLLQPRWIRVNTLKSEKEELFPRHLHQPDLRCMTRLEEPEVCHVDEHIPDLLALPPGTDLTKSPEYTAGKIILQDKASCFPAYLLLGETKDSVGDVIDACAAPGNKTSHLASILYSRQAKHSSSEPRKLKSNVFACERDPRRSQILQKMIQVAGAEKIVTVLPNQDFFALDQNDTRYSEVTHLLLDPTCSGSGIVGREDVPKLNLPEDPKDRRRRLLGRGNEHISDAYSKKRKRLDDAESSDGSAGVAILEEEDTPKLIDEERLQKLSSLQSRMVERAMSFPAARRITYSTCSLHATEDETVVARALHSQVAKTRGWRLLGRAEQVGGMREWRHRGIRVDPVDVEQALTEEERSACIRCYPGTEDGTMGFFVCCFTRDEIANPDAGDDSTGDEFSGFDD